MPLTVHGRGRKAFVLRGVANLDKHRAWKHRRTRTHTHTYTHAYPQAFVARSNVYGAATRLVPMRHASLLLATHGLSLHERRVWRPV
jgi:hypothetical protein